MLNASIAPNTKLTYNTGLRAFSQFRSEWELPQNWPPGIESLVQFMAFLSLSGKSAATIHSYIMSISFQCKLINVDDTTKRFVISKMMEGTRRLKYSRDTRLPVTLVLLEKILHVLPVVCSNTFETKLFSTAYTLAFFGFLEWEKLQQHQQILSARRKLFSSVMYLWINPTQ